MSSLYGGPQLIGMQSVLWRLTSANMNTTADQAFVKQFVFTTFVVTSIIATNASTSLTLAAGGIYPSASKAGTALVAAAQVYSGLTGSTVVVNPTLATTTARTDAALFLSLTTSQGGAATADFYIIGVALN